RDAQRARQRAGGQRHGFRYGDHGAALLARGAGRANSGRGRLPGGKHLEFPPLSRQLARDAHAREAGDGHVWPPAFDSPQPATAMTNARHWASAAERGALWGMKVVAFAYRVLGRRVSGAILVPVVAYFYLTDPHGRRCSLAFLRRAYNAKGLAAPTSWTSFRHFLMFAMKSLDAFAAWSGKPGPVAVEGAEAVERTLAEGKGALLFVSHLGNADVSRACLAERIGKPITMLLHTRHARLYNQMLRSARGGGEVDAVEVTEIGPEVAIDLQERIARAEWIAMAADRTPILSQARTARVPFLAADAAFSLGPDIRP